jgi:hypothetical protein
MCRSSRVFILAQNLLSVQYAWLYGYSVCFAVHGEVGAPAWFRNNFSCVVLKFVWKLDHVLSSCIIVEVVYVVKVVIIVGMHSLYHVSMPAPQSQSLRVTLDLDTGSDKFQSFNHGEELNTTVQLQIMVRAIYSAGLSIYIHGITSDKRTREVQPLLLVREGNTLLIRYLLDTRVRYSTYSPNFKSQKGSIESLNFCIITS